MTEINEILEDELDKQFPKGDKARGRALVLFAIAQIEIDKARAEALQDVERIKKWLENIVWCNAHDESWIKETIRKLSELQKLKGVRE